MLDHKRSFSPYHIVFHSFSTRINNNTSNNTRAVPLAQNSNQPQISIKLAEPKPFNFNTMQVHTWLSILKLYFFVVGLTYAATKEADTLAVC